MQATGRAVPLRQVAEVEVQFQPANVKRQDRLKTVTVDAQVEPGHNAIAIARRLRAFLDERSETLPAGYRFEQGGELESSAESQQSIGVQLPVAGLVILLLLVAQFDSLRRPAIILLTIPLGLIFATVLTLGMVPVLYALFFGVRFDGAEASPSGA